MSDATAKESSAALKSVLLVKHSTERDVDSGTTSGSGKIELQSGPIDGNPFVRFSTLSVSLGGEDVFYRFESTFRVTFEWTGDVIAEDEAASVEQYIAQETVHISEPYHRQLLADAMARSGMPVLTLPNVTGGTWTQSAAKSDQEMAHL